jgi:hypothetical protein
MNTWKNRVRIIGQSTEEAAVVCSKELYRHLPGQTGQNQGRRHSAVNISGTQANN